MISNLQKFYINSKNASSGTDANFVYPLQINKDINVCSVTQWSIPISMYNISANTGNTFKLFENNNANELTITIPEGMYTQAQLMTKVGTLMTNASVNAITYTITLNNTVDYSDGKIKITCIVGGQPSIIVNRLFFNDNVLCEMLGFNINYSDNFIANIVSPNVTNIGAKNSLYLQSDIANNNNNNIGKLSSNNILAVAFVSYQAPFNYVNVSFDMINNMTNINVKSLYNFWITDEDNDIIDLRGCDTSIQICCFQYHFDYYPMLKAIYTKLKDSDNNNKNIKIMNY